MKRGSFVLSLFLVLFWSVSAYAVEVTLLGESYTREKGKPVTVTDYFTPAHEGAGKITIINGYMGAKPISSARIWHNGELISEPSDWNSNVTSLIIPVTLYEGENYLEVRLNAKPGGKISLVVTQELAWYESHTKPVENEKVVIDSDTGIKFVNDQLLIFFEKNTPQEVINNIISDINGIVVGYVPIAKLYQIELINTPTTTNEKLNELIDILDADTNILSVSRNKFSNMFIIDDPNDPYPRKDTQPIIWDQQLPSGYNWGLEVIKMLSAWEVTTGGPHIKVGVVDKGFDLTHWDLKDLVPPITGGGAGGKVLAEKEDPVNPCDSSDPPDCCPDNCCASPNADKYKEYNKHGTHVLGIIGAGGNNRTGITGIMWRKSLHVYRTTGFDSDTLEGIESLLRNGVKVINLSVGNSWGETEKPCATCECRKCFPPDDNGNTWGCPSSSDSEDVALFVEDLNLYKTAMDGWIESPDIGEFLIVQAAGNEDIESIWGLNFNTLLVPKYKNHIIVVGSIRPPIKEDNELIYYLSDFSNYGEYVDIVAPGGWSEEEYNHKIGIYSTIWTEQPLPNDTFEGYTTGWGTSMAAPHVTGVAGLVWSLARNHVFGGELTASQVKNIIIKSADTKAIDDDESRRNDKPYKYKVLNAIKAVNYVVLPKVNLFEIEKTTVTVGESITVGYEVEDYKGLNRVELWRAPYDDNNCNETNQLGCVGVEVKREDDLSGIGYSGYITDETEEADVGTWLYGVHVVDSEEHCTTQLNRDCTTGESNGEQGFEPIKVIVNPVPAQYFISTQLFYPDSIDLGMGYDDSVDYVTVSGPFNPSISDHGSSISVTLSGYSNIHDVIGAVYEFTIHFKDGTSAVQTYEIESLNTNFSWMVSPADGESVTSNTPTLEWYSLEPAPNTHIVVSDSSGIIWWSDNFPSGITSTDYNSNGKATADLVFGNEYGIQINSYDVNWNQATTWSSFRVEEPLTQNTITRVSVGPNGIEGNGDSFGTTMSPDGRFIGFGSNASNLIPGGDTNGYQDGFIHDRLTGITEQVNVSSDGIEGEGHSGGGYISAEGRYVGFQTYAGNLVPNDTIGYDVFVRDRFAGTTERVSVAFDGSAANNPSQGGSISADGRFVAFWSGASNLVPNDTNNSVDVFVHDRLTSTTERVSVATDGSEGYDSRYNSLHQAFSDNGEIVVFSTQQKNLVPEDTNNKVDVFTHNRLTGVTERISIAWDGGEANGWSTGPSVSADGRFIVFNSSADNLIQGDTIGNTLYDVFVFDRITGTTERVNVASDGTEASDASYNPMISADGRFVVFSSLATNLVPDDTNSVEDIFVHDRVNGNTERVNVNSEGIEANDYSKGAWISADGKIISFYSRANNLIPDDTNGYADVFVASNPLF